MCWTAVGWSIDASVDECKLDKASNSTATVDAWSAIASTTASTAAFAALVSVAFKSVGTGNTLA